MQFCNANNVKIFNLSAGKSIPDFLSEQQKNRLKKQYEKKKKRDGTEDDSISLIQDLTMPCISNCVKMSPDLNYIVATGTYKPRMRCYDVNQLSMKFERGLDAEVVQFLFLDKDYGKILFLQDDRYIEIHTQYGRHYRWRIPKFGRDLDFHKPSVQAYFVGASSEVYRFNLETGQFQAPLTTDATEIFCCEFNPEHYLFACGTKEGTVECWDPRDRTRAGVLDITQSKFIEDIDRSVLPAVTSLKFRDGINMAVGTSTGHVLLYDIRGRLPVYVKDHQFDLPIKSVTFHKPLDLVLSMDRKIVKLWSRTSGEPLTAIQPESDLNSMCLVPESGLIFLANESPQILTYYLPDLGVAPKWCAFLDKVTEEMEQTKDQTVYDDYKFLTRQELDALGMSQYIGSNLLRAYMHGFFVDIRLYRKFQALVGPASYEQYRRSEIERKIAEKTENQFKVNKKRKLPDVNKDLAYRLYREQEEIAAGEMNKKKFAKRTGNLLEDERFKSLFEDKSYQIDTKSEEYRLLNPVLSRLEVKKDKDKQSIMDKFDPIQELEVGAEQHGSKSKDNESESDSVADSESEEDSEEDVKDQELDRKMQKTKRAEPTPVTKPKFFEMKGGEQFNNFKANRKKQLKKTLEERLQEEGGIQHTSIGNREFTYKLKQNSRAEEKVKAMKEHQLERRKIRRSAGDITKQLKSKPKFWMGKRVQ